MTLLKQELMSQIPEVKKDIKDLIQKNGELRPLCVIHHLSRRIRD